MSELQLAQQTSPDRALLQFRNEMPKRPEIAAHRRVTEGSWQQQGRRTEITEPSR